MDSSFFLYTILTTIGCILHIVGTYLYKLYDTVTMSNFPTIYLLSIVINTMVTVIRVPTNVFLGKQLNMVFMEVFYLFILFVVTTVYSMWVLQEKIPIHTYVIMTVIVGLFMLNAYLNQYGS